MRTRGMIIGIVLGVALAAGAHAAAPERAKPPARKPSGPPIEAVDPDWTLSVKRSELEAVIGRFIASYSAGDIDRFMQLFTQKVNTTAGEKSAQDLRAEYAEHFLATTERFMNLGNARYEKSGDAIMAEVDLKLREHFRLDNKKHTYTGAVRFYLTQQGSRWLISGLFFAYDPPAN
jgi:hypothetical protein